jgi:hypothetical protein
MTVSSSCEKTHFLALQKAIIPTESRYELSFRRSRAPATRLMFSESATGETCFLRARMDKRAVLFQCGMRLR